LRRLVQDKAPENVSQLVMWGVAGMGWDQIAAISKGWANSHELALAKQLVANLDSVSGDSGRLMVDISAKESGLSGVADGLKDQFRDATVLGLPVSSGVPVRPNGPAVAAKIAVGGTADKPELFVQVASSDARGTSWAAMGKFTAPAVLDEAGKLDAAATSDAVAEGILKNLVDVSVVKGSKVKGKDSFAIVVKNQSSLVLNGLAVTGASAKPTDAPKALVGIALSPKRALTLPTTAESVEKAGLKDGIRVLALDLSGL
jgi:hypothetical protein